MKILKIELQNINSLKSETPIIIDFQSEVFQDVGLFAITGSTGAGKTTILDAITIALYHSVPRFSGSKANLVDVVSYGAEEALVNLTFEAQNTVFEAHWSLRLTSKTGKLLANPIETVRLKNLTSQEIISEKKMDVKAKVEEITKLSYNQFLRSVMLAQGEFAAFLTAKPNEKGELLEQITGEEIYKKIGFQTSARVFQERKAYDKIRATLNEQDILSEEEFEALHIEKVSVQNEKEKIAVRLVELNRVLAWYEENEGVAKEKEALAIKVLQVESKEKEHENTLKILAKHEQTLPFKEDLRELDRNVVEYEERTLKIKTVEQELGIAQAKLEVLDGEVNVLKNTEIEQAALNHSWMSKLEEVAEIDVKLNAEQENLSKQENQKEELSRELALQNLALKNNQGKVNSNKEACEKINTYLNAHSNIPAVELVFEDWSYGLKQRLDKIEQLAKYDLSISSRQKEIDALKNRLTQKKAESVPLQENVEASKQKSDFLNERLKQVDISQLNLQKDALTLLCNQLLSAVDLAEENKTVLDKIARYKTEEAAFKSAEVTLLNTENELIEAFKKAESSLNEAEKCYRLEQQVVRLENEREALVAGQPCQLCGSTTHPFVEKYQQIEVAKTELLVLARKKQLGEITANLNAVTVKREVNQRDLVHRTTVLKEVEEEQELIHAKFKQLNVKTAIQEIEQLKTSHLAAEEKAANFNTKYKEVQKWQVDLRELQNTSAEQGITLQLLNSAVVELEASIKSNEQEGGKSQEERQMVVKGIRVLTDDLKSQLADYRFELPNPEETLSFIASTRALILEYSAKSKKKDTLENERKVIEQEIENISKQHAEKRAVYDKVKTDITETTEKYADLKASRIKILPLAISTQEKRIELNGILKSVQENVGLKEKSFLATQEDVAVKQNTLETLNAALGEQSTLIEALKLKINHELESSEFDSIAALRLNRIDSETEERFKSIRQNLANEKIQIRTLTTRIAEVLLEIAQAKDFDMDKTDALSASRTAKLQEEDCLRRLGELNQKFLLDKQIKARNSGVMDQLSVQEKEISKWEQLFALLGGSKLAFNIYVQRLTLKSLIALANIHLFKLNKRYALKMNDTYKVGEELNFELVDHYQADQMRLVDTSSGGEKFLISLSLALGLSDLASHNIKIQSLFIDEGFGTLDNNTLETVISTLETLQAQGKMIGIISHVENLKERIPVQIKVLKKRDGESTIEIC